MKKLILSLSLAFAFSFANAQEPVIDTLVKNIVAVRITPVKASFQDTTLSVFLGAYAISDNLKNSATFYWCLMLPAKDSTGAIIGAGQITNQGNYTMTAAQYSAWCNSQPCNTYPFVCIAQAYGLTFPTTTSTTNRKP